MKALTFATLAGFCWGIGEVCTKSALHTKQIGPMAVLAIRCATALPPALLVYLLASHWFKFEPSAWEGVSASTWLKLLLGSGLLAGFGGAFFFYLGLKYGDISRVKPVAFALAPAIAVLLGWFLLGEEVTVKRLLGVALVLAGVVLLTSK
jgi:uncharacterized membrane protein